MENSTEDAKLKNTTRLTLERRHQLIDLNKEYVNFEIFFECKSVDATKDFEMLVINQDQLDSIDLSNLAMKRTRGGYISGNIVADEDKYQNYFLVIRACEDSDPLEVDLTIQIKPIAPNKEKLRQMEVASSQQQTPTPHPLSDQGSVDGCPMAKSKGRNMLLILGAVVVIGLVIYFYNKRRSKGGEPSPSLQEAVGSKEVCFETASSVSSSSSASGNLLQDLIRNNKKSVS